ncbi:MAG: alpha/beta fold hydrolase [Fimbriiglobus sp.]
MNEISLPSSLTPIIFLSGLAADERLFEPQLAAFPNLRVQPWIPPLPGETLRQYAARVAPLVDPGCPCVVGGASFGGMVALEMSEHLQALGCILIGSVRSPMGITRRWRALWPLTLFGPEGLQLVASLIARFGKPFLPAITIRRLRRLAAAKASFERWGMCAVLNWRPSPASRKVKVYHIHGAEDRILLVALGQPDVIVANGSHALSLFSPDAVNKFIQDVMKDVMKTHYAP